MFTAPKRYLSPLLGHPLYRITPINESPQANKQTPHLKQTGGPKDEVQELIPQGFIFPAGDPYKGKKAQIKVLFLIKEQIYAIMAFQKGGIRQNPKIGRSRKPPKTAGLLWVRPGGS